MQLIWNDNFILNKVSHIWIPILQINILYMAKEKAEQLF